MANDPPKSHNDPPKSHNDPSESHNDPSKSKESDKSKEPDKLKQKVRQIELLFPSMDVNRVTKQRLTINTTIHHYTYNEKTKTNDDKPETLKPEVHVLPRSTTLHHIHVPLECDLHIVLEHLEENPNKNQEDIPYSRYTLDLQLSRNEKDAPVARQVMASPIGYNLQNIVEIDTDVKKK